MSGYQVLIVIMCFILNFNDGIDVLLVSYTGPAITADWALSKTELGYIFSAGLAGMTAGCFLLAPLGDKLGRRPIFLLSLFAITTGMLLVYFTSAYWQLILCRCLTGFGIGGILPNLATIAAEFSNKKTRDFNVGIVQAGWPLGAILTGFVAAKIIPAYGWRFAYLISGGFSLNMFAVVYFFLPESVVFLAKQRSQEALLKINSGLGKIGKAPIDQLPEQEIVRIKHGLKDLFSSELRGTTLLLWTGIFFGFLTLYTLLSWIPTLAKETGMPFTLSVYMGTVLNFGAFTGVFVMGLGISKYGIKKVQISFMILAFVVMLIFGNFHLSYLWMFILTFFIGFFVQGGFNAFYPAATRIYREEIRATGVGLAMGAGRFGAILGPVLFGIFSDMGVSIPTRFLLFSLPLLVAAFSMWKMKSAEMS